MKPEKNMLSTGDENKWIRKKKGLCEINGFFCKKLWGSTYQSSWQKFQTL